MPAADAPLSQSVSVTEGFPPNKKQEIQGGEEGEEDATLSWSTSSVTSISPDNPLFQSSKMCDPSKQTILKEGKGVISVDKMKISASLVSTDVLQENRSAASIMPKCEPRSAPDAPPSFDDDDDDSHNKPVASTPPRNPETKKSTWMQPLLSEGETDEDDDLEVSYQVDGDDDDRVLSPVRPVPITQEDILRETGLGIEEMDGINYSSAPVVETTVQISTSPTVHLVPKYEEENVVEDNFDTTTWYFHDYRKHSSFHRMPSTIKEEDEDLEATRHSTTPFSNKTLSPPKEELHEDDSDPRNDDERNPLIIVVTAKEDEKLSRSWSSDVLDNFKDTFSGRTNETPLRKASEAQNGTFPQTVSSSSLNGSPGRLEQALQKLKMAQIEDTHRFSPVYTSTKFLEDLSKKWLRKHYAPTFAAATWVGFWALLLVTCSNYVLMPMRDAIALAVGVKYVPALTLASTVLAFGSSVPIGWLFEAPDPNRRKMFKRMGLTRGETQGTSLALFYRCFAVSLLSYAVGFSLISALGSFQQTSSGGEIVTWLLYQLPFVSHLQPLFTFLGKGTYIAFFLMVHLMKLHSTSLAWGVVTEAMDYEEVARKRNLSNAATTSNMNQSGRGVSGRSLAVLNEQSSDKQNSRSTRLQRLGFIGFGGTVGGVMGSVLASSMARVLRLPGLLILSAVLLEVSAELSIELGRIMQKHWEDNQMFQSSNDLASLDASMRRSSSMGSMKRVASGNSLNMNRVKSATDLSQQDASSTSSGPNAAGTASAAVDNAETNDNTFMQRLMRGITTILRSRLLMAVFTYNALYASTNVMLSFQRAALVANRHESEGAESSGSSTEADTAFLANINMASSLAIFALQASGIGAWIAHTVGSQGVLALMPGIRLLGVLALAWWHHTSNGQPPNLIIFLIVDECCKVMNLAVAKPVRESLWRGLSNEARYEAKPIVDTLANRWGGGSAAFMVSFLNRTLDLFGVQPNTDGTRNVFGLPPILFLCTIIATWWFAVSADLGQVRKRIDIELKKRQ